MSRSGSNRQPSRSSAALTKPFRWFVDFFLFGSLNSSKPNSSGRATKSSAKMRDIITADYLISGLGEGGGEKTVGKYLLTPEEVDETVEPDSPFMAARKCSTLTL